MSILKLTKYKWNIAEFYIYEIIDLSTKYKFIFVKYLFFSDLLCQYLKNM
jgi:hypothetical protein